MTRLMKKVQKDRPRVAATARAATKAHILSYLISERANGQDWKNKEDLLRSMRYAKFGTAINTASLRSLITSGWIEREFRMTQVEGGMKNLVYFRVTQLGLDNRRFCQGVKDVIQERIMLFFNDPMNANRMDITRQEVATAAGFSNPSTKSFCNSWWDLEHNKTLIARSARYGRYHLV